MSDIVSKVSIDRNIELWIYGIDRVLPSALCIPVCFMRILNESFDASNTAIVVSTSFLFVGIVSNSIPISISSISPFVLAPRKYEVAALEL